MIVMKYGGTSVADSHAMNRIIDIVRSCSGNKLLVVLSACAGMTDRLLRMLRMAASARSEQSNTLMDEVRQHHTALVKSIVPEGEPALKLMNRVEQLLAELDRFRFGVSLLGECTPRASDFAVSYGELLSTTIFEAALSAAGFKSAWADARQIVKTDANYGSAHVDFAVTEEKAKILAEQFDKKDVIVTQGFIASAADGTTTTLGRGGSDYSAAVFGAVLGAEEIQIWTDVEGILTADPRIAPQAVTVRNMSFGEVREMAQYGAKVVHPDTVMPAVERNIPVRVLNTFSPNGGNTLIRSTDEWRPVGLSSATLKRNCLFVSVISDGGAPPQALLESVSKAAEQHGARVYCSSVAERSVRIVCDCTPALDDRLASVLFGKQYNIVPAALIGVTGELTAELAAQFFSELAVGIADCLLAAFVGASEWSLPIVVRHDCADAALVAIHEHILKYNN